MVEALRVLHEEVDESKEGFAHRNNTKCPLTYCGGMVVEALGVLHEEVDEQEEQHEGGGSQVERRQHPALALGEGGSCLGRGQMSGGVGHVCRWMAEHAGSAAVKGVQGWGPLLCWRSPGQQRT